MDVITKQTIINSNKKYQMKRNLQFNAILHLDIHRGCLDIHDGHHMAAVEGIHHMGIALEVVGYTYQDQGHFHSQCQAFVHLAFHMASEEHIHLDQGQDHQNLD